MDLTKLSDADLIALRDNKLNEMSDEGLRLISGVTPKVDNSSDFVRGFKSYLPQTKETFGGVQTLLGAGAEKMFGQGPVSEYLMGRGAKNIVEASKEQSKTAKESDSFSKAWDNGIWTVLTDWLPYQVGAGAANLLETGATAVGGAALGSVVPGIGTGAGALEGIVGKALIKKGVKEAAEKILKDKGEDAAQAYIEKEAKKVIGSTAGLVTQAGFHGMGETTSRALQEGMGRGETARDLDLSRLLPAAAVHSVADFISNKIGLGALDGLAKPTQNMLLNVAKGITVTGAKEIPPELLQSAMERYGAKLPLDDKNAINEYIDTAAAAVGMSVVPGGIGGMRTRAAVQPTPEANQQITPPVTPPPQGQLALPLEGGQEVAGPRVVPPTVAAAPVPDVTNITTLRDQYDTLSREIQRLGTQFDNAKTNAEKQQLLVQGQKLDFARQDILGQLKALKPEPITAPEGQMALDFTQPEQQVNLAYYQPKTSLPQATLLGQQPATPTDITQLRLDTLQRMQAAGEQLTPAEQFQLRELQKAQQAQAAPQLEIPTEVGAGARPTSYVIDDKVLDTFGFSKAATKIRNALRGLDLMKPEDRAKFEDLIAKHERKNAKVDMQAVEDFKMSIPEAVPAREVPEAAGLPAREYTPRQQYQQAREALFAFGQEAAPISPKDRVTLAKQEDEAKNGPRVPSISRTEPRTSEPSVQLPSGQLEPTETAAAPAATRLASPEPVVGKPISGERGVGEARTAPLSVFEQMISQVAPEGKPALVEKKTKAKKQDAFAKAEEYQKELNKKSRKGTAYRTAKPNMDGMSVSDVQNVVNRIVDGWKNSPLIQVVQFESQLPPAVQDQIKRDGVIRPQGLWDEDTQAVYLIADNITEPKEVGLTVAHEALGHYGLRTILGENYSKVMNQMYGNAEVKRRADNKIARGMDKETAVEEVLAEMAEKHEAPSVINKLITMLRQLMAKVGFPMKGVTNSEIKALLEQSRQYVIEGKGEAGKGGMKVGKVFSGDAPIFYSKLAAMTQHAPKNLRDGASGKAWADWINSNAGKFGVKKEEIEWSGVDDLLALMHKQFKFTSKDVNDMLKEQGVKVSEDVRGIKDEAKLKELNKEERRLNMKAFDLAEEMLAKNVFTPNTWYYKQAYKYNRDKAKPDAQLGDYLENIHVPILEGSFDKNLFDPAFEDEYTKKVEDIQQQLKDLAGQQFAAYGKETRFDSYKTHGGKDYTEIVLTLPVDFKYGHPHWPEVSNPIAHTRFSKFTDADGQQVLLVDEVQSDWGQDATKYGFKNEDGTYKNLDNYLKNLQSRFIDKWVEDYMNRPEEDKFFGKTREEARSHIENTMYLHNNLDMARALGEEHVYDEMISKDLDTVQKAPFVGDTKLWTALVVKRLLRYAADNGISRIAFIDGQSAFERFPKDKEGNSTEKGMKTYYDQILPSVVKDVLRKLGADSKPVRSDIEFAPTIGYYVTENGQDIAGPFEYKTEAVDEAMRLMREEGKEITRMDISEREDANFKSFMAFDLAPETAERVKEGQAMFRAATPEGAQAEQDMAAFGGRPEQKQKSFIDKKRDSFQKTADEWRAASTRNDSKVAATFGKLQNIASFDQAFNNRLYNHFMKLKAKGVMTLDEAKQALLRISTSQALHRTNLANQIIDRGNYKYDLASNRWYAIDDPINMGKFEDVINRVATRLGVEPTRARQIIGAAYEANRLNSLYDDLHRAKAELTVAEKSLSKLKDPKLRAIKKELIKALEAEVEELDDKTQHKTYAQVQAGMRLYNSSPEIQEGTEIWNTMRKRVVKMLVETGVKTEEQAKKWLDESAYVPFFRDIEEEKAAGPNVMARGLRESMKDYQMKGSMKEVHDPIDNMYKWMQWSIARAVSNQQLNVMLDQYQAALPSEVNEGRGADSNTFTVYRDGVLRFYNVADPAIAQAFVGLEPIIFPGISWLTGSSNFLRHAVTRNPIFAASQLFMDSYTAMFTSGLKNPFGLLKEIAKEVVATAQGTSTARTDLMRAGILETHDYAALSEADAIGKRLGLEKPGAWAKLAQRLDHLAAASDNVIRQGVYNQAMKELKAAGVPEAKAHVEAMEKAAEIVNFRRVSGDPRVQFISRIVPFFNAYLQVASVSAKTLTGRGISPQERDAAIKTLIATTAKITMLSMVYSMAVGDDEDYLKKNRITRDRMWMIPGSGGLGLPVRADIFALPKVVGEYTYQMMADNGYTDSKMFKEAMSRAVMGSLAVPSEGIPQFVRPTLGVMTNYDFFQKREIVNATMRKLEVSEQYTKNTSEMARAFSSILEAIGIEASPLNLDYLMKGYLGTVGTLAALATNDILNVMRGGPARPASSMRDIVAGIPNAGAFVSRDENTAVLSDYYEAARDVNKVVATASRLKTKPEELRAYIQEHQQEYRMKGAVQAINKQLVALKRQEQMIRDSSKNADEKAELLDRIDAQRNRMTANVMKLRKQLYE